MRFSVFRGCIGFSSFATWFQDPYFGVMDVPFMDARRANARLTSA